MLYVIDGLKNSYRKGATTGVYGKEVGSVANRLGSSGKTRR